MARKKQIAAGGSPATVSPLPVSSLAAAQAAVRAKYGVTSATRLSDLASLRSTVKEVIPTGLSVLDRVVLGCGGLPVGRAVEVFAEEGAGKSSLGYHFLGAAQRAGANAVLIETEQSLDTARAALFGVDPDELLLLQPDHLEQMLDQLGTIGPILGKSGRPTLVVWDGLAATPTRQEVENGLFGEEMASDRAKTLSRACRTIKLMMADHRVCWVVVNQVRTKFGGGFGSPDMEAVGGKAVKFTFSLRLQLLGGSAIKVDGAHLAKVLTVMAVKTRFGPPWMKARLRLDYSTGWNEVWSTIHHAKNAKLIESNAAYTFSTYESACAALRWPVVAVDLGDDDLGNLAEVTRTADEDRDGGRE